MTSQDVCRLLDCIARREPRAEVIGPCRRAALKLREGRGDAQRAVLSEMEGLAVGDTVRPSLQLVLAWASGKPLAKEGELLAQQLRPMQCRVGKVPPRIER